MWREIGSSYIPEYYVAGFSNNHASKPRVDPYAYKFFSDYYGSRGMELELVHSKWRYGIPKRTSAFRDVVRFRNKIVQPEEDIWRQCEQWAQRHFSVMRDSQINWDLEYAQLFLNKQTSPGFPWTKGFDGAPAFKTKADVFKWEDGKFAQKHYSMYLNDISDENYCPKEWYTLSAKKELRKVSKIETDSFRAYTAASWRNVCAGIAVCADMNQKFYSSWNRTAAFVGGSTFHGCWNKMFQRLNKHKNAFECDVSAWDSTLSPEMILSFSNVMWSFVRGQDKTKENKVRWDNIFREIFDSVILCPNGDVFLKCQGNPSGHPFTIVTNTIIHYMLFCYAWLMLAPPELRTYEAFDKFVELALCGDDSLGTVHDIATSFYTVEEITRVWITLGIKAKVEALSSGQLVDRNFLSQRTRRIGDLFVPYPDTDKVISSLIWHTHADVHVRWSYLKACALRISSFYDVGAGHSRDLLNSYIQYLEMEYSSELRSYCTRKGLDMFSWEEVHAVWKTDDELVALYILAEDGRAISDQARLKVAEPVCSSVQQIISEVSWHATQSEEECEEEKDESSGR